MQLGSEDVAVNSCVENLSDPGGSEITKNFACFCNTDGCNRSRREAENKADIENLKSSGNIIWNEVFFKWFFLACTWLLP